MLLDIAARRSDFRALHDEGYFLLPTAWDVGGAKRLEYLGFAGLATTIKSQAWALGRNPHDLTRDDVLKHMRQLVNATEIAVSADYGYGFATDAAELADNVGKAIDTGVAALSIGDCIADARLPLRDAAARIQTCRRVIDRSDADVLLVARAEFIPGVVGSTSAFIERLVALSTAGADVLCLPDLGDAAAVKAVVLAVSPRPLDVQLVRRGLSAAELERLGVRRISVGDAFAEASWASFEHDAEEFTSYGDLAPDFLPMDQYGFR